MPIYKAVPCSACNTGPSEEEERETRWQLSGVTPQERERCTLSGFAHDVNREMWSAFSAAADWGQGTGPPFLLLVGSDRGVGKTHLGIAAAGECILRGVAVAFCVVPRLLGELRASVRADSPVSLETVRRRVEEYPCVVLDDLGAGKTSEWAAGELFTVLNERWRNERRTLITSNLRAAQLGESSLSRLVDARLSRVVVCKGQDYRKGMWR